MRKLLLRLSLAAGLCVTGTSHADPNPILDGETFNVLSLQDDKAYTYRVGLGAWTSSILEIAPQLAVLWGPNTSALPGLPLSAFVIPNDGLGANPQPTMGDGVPRVQAFSIVGLSLANLGDPDSTLPLTVSVEPPAGSYVGPQTLTVRVSGGAGFPISTTVLRGDGTSQVLEGPVGTFQLPPGTWNLTITGARGPDDEAITGTWHIANSTSPLTDTDNDGLPDLIELASGLDIFSGDLTRDTDADGWTNIDEWLRGCPPSFVPTSGFSAPVDCSCTALGDGRTNCKPTDSDNDGWSDWDEDVRSTNPNAASSIPTATRLYEAEVLVDYAATTNGVTAETRSGSIIAEDIEGRPLDVRHHDGQALTGAWGRVPLVASERVSLGGNPGDPFSVRMRGETPWVIRSQVYTANGDSLVPSPIVYKALARAAESVDISRITFLIETRSGDVRGGEEGPSWETAEDWRLEARSRLVNMLLVPTYPGLSPESTARTALVESLICWHRDSEGASAEIGKSGLNLEPAPLTVLGVEGDKIEVARAVVALGARYADHHGDEVPWQFGLRILLEDIESWIFEPDLAEEAYASWLSGVKDLYLEAGANVWPSQRASTIDVELARRLSPGNDKGVFNATRVLAYFSLEFLQTALSPQEIDALNLPYGDVDGDNRTQDEELAAYAEFATNPLEADTDLDGLNDGQDLCPLEGSNACLEGLISLLDFDKDRVLDVVDNCPDHPNGSDPENPDVPASQLDSDGDGLGDVCDMFAHIASPFRHMLLETGDSIVLSAAPSGTRPLSDFQIDWAVLEGKDNTVFTSSVPVGSIYTFASPGDYVVLMEATDPLTEESFSERRYISVFSTPAPPPVLFAIHPDTAGEGATVDFNASATSDVPGELLYEWNIDDEILQGADVSKVFESEGTYDVICKVTHASGSKTTQQTTITITDTEPEAGFTVAPTGIDLEYVFTDTSVSWDEIIQIRWHIQGLETRIQYRTGWGPGDHSFPVDISVGDGESVPIIEETVSEFGFTRTLPHQGEWTVVQTVMTADGDESVAELQVIATGSGLEVMATSVDFAWRTKTFEYPISDPIVIIGIPQVYDGQPSVPVAIRNVTSTGFQIRLQPWLSNFLSTYDWVEVPVLAIERGRHEFANGTEWLAGRFSVGGPSWLSNWTAVAFPAPFDEKPVVLLNAQTSNSSVTSALRLREPRRLGFEARRVVSKTLNNPSLGNETAGYVAITGLPDHPGGISGEGLPMWQQRVRLRHDWRVRAGRFLRLAEEVLSGHSTEHEWETVNLLLLGESLFGATVTDRELDPFVLQSR